MSESVCRKGGAGKGGLEREERGTGWSGGWGGRSARCCRGVGRERGGWEGREEKEEGKETNQIIQNNKSTMLDDLECNGIKDPIRNAHTLP